MEPRGAGLPARRLPGRPPERGKEGRRGEAPSLLSALGRQRGRDAEPALCRREQLRGARAGAAAAVRARGYGRGLSRARTLRPAPGPREPRGAPAAAPAAGALMPGCSGSAAGCSLRVCWARALGSPRLSVELASDVLTLLK